MDEYVYVYVLLTEVVSDEVFTRRVHVFKTFNTAARALDKYLEASCVPEEWQVESSYFKGSFYRYEAYPEGKYTTDHIMLNVTKRNVTDEIPLEPILNLTDDTVSMCGEG